MDSSLPGSSVHRKVIALVLFSRKENIAYPLGSSIAYSADKNTGVRAMPSSRGSSPPRGQTHVSCTAGGFFTIWVTREMVWGNIKDLMAQDFTKILIFNLILLNLEKCHTHMCVIKYLYGLPW